MLSRHLTRPPARHALYRLYFSDLPSLTARSTAKTLLGVEATTPSWNNARNIVTTSACRLFDSKKKEKTQESNIIIFPELPNDTSETNEFLEIPTTGVIQFDKLTVEKCIRATGKLSIELEHFIDDFSKTLNEDFADKGNANAKMTEFIEEMERHFLPLQYNLNLMNSFQIIRPDEFNFKSFDEFMNKRISKMKLRFLNRHIYCFMCEMKARRENGNGNSGEQPSADGSILSGETLKNDRLFKQQQKNQLVDRYIRETKLLGLGLKHQDQVAMYKLCNDRLIQEQNRFITTTRLATDVFQSQIISPQFLDCLPDYVITQINHHDADSVFNSFMRYCPDQNLRKDFWLSFYSRASPFLGSNLSNILTIEKIREYRYRKARLLGYDNFAQMAIDLRSSGGSTMAGSVENVRAFVNGLAVRSDARFEKNMKELTDFATEGAQKRATKVQLPSQSNLVEKLNLWDLKYFERLFLRDTYKIDSRDVRAHFPLDRVVSGMFEFVEELFGIKIVEITNEKNVWGKNARQFKVFGNSAKFSAEYGSFYFDPFQRVSRIIFPISRSEALHTKPVVFFLMNYTAGSGSIVDQYDNQVLSTGKELLNFSQVIDLFGKFGYVLQHLLTEVSVSQIGPLYNLEGDAQDIVCKFMRMWPLNSYETLAKCSSHIKTGEPISQEFFERIPYYHFGSFDLKYQLYLMALDLNLHTLRNHNSSLQKQTWKEWMTPFDAIEDDGHICSFLDIFSGNGQEGIYYCDKWAEVIAADIFDSFRDTRNGTMKSPEQLVMLGERFKDTFLAQSGAVETNELFRRFLGRDPTLNGYLSINGFE